VLKVRACVEPTTGASGQPTQPGQTGGSGQPTQPGQTPASGQPTQPGQTGGSVQPTQPGQTDAAGATSAASLLSTLFSSTTTSIITGTTKKQCAEMEAIDEPTSKKITVFPDDIPQNKKTDFQPTSNTGVSFPSNDKKPTITVNFDKPAEVQSVTIPRDKTQGANVEQFEVTFYSPNGSKVNPTPIQSTDSPKDDKSKPATVDSSKIPVDTPVSKVEITVVKTTDDESPKGVVLKVRACVEPTTDSMSQSTQLSSGSAVQTSFVTSRVTWTSGGSSVCETPIELTNFGSQIFSQIKFNNQNVAADALASPFPLPAVPTAIYILFNKEVIIQNISIVNPADSKITSISALTEFDSTPKFNENPNNPSVKYSPYVENVIPLTVVIHKTSDDTVPTNARLSIVGCAHPTTRVTKAQVENDTTISDTPITSSTPTSSLLSTVTAQSGASQQTSTLTSGSASTSVATLPSTIFGSTATSIITGTTKKQCAEMEAIDEPTSKKITVFPDDIPQNQKTDFQPTSNTGVSFPSNDKKPTITVNFDKPAEVQSVTIPRDKTQGANVEQFEVTFYYPNGSKVNPTPIQSTDSPKDERSKPATVDSSKIPADTPVSKVEITVVKTTDDESPKGVVLKVRACVEPTTGASGQPTQSGQTGGSGQPTQPGQTPASGQPTQPGQTPASGQPTQPGQTPASGQPTQP
ncbi:unnamed protein product, partial [Adineta ricciae]